MYHMGNRYYTNHQKIHDLHYRSTFLPMLCSRPSIKDVVIPKSNSSFASHVSLTSPKIGCMGQVKRHNNNKVCNSSSSSHHHHRRQLSTDTTNTSHNINNKYSKLKRLFSSKSFTTRSIDSTSRSTNKQESNNKIIINIVDMDPPLPVIKKVLINKPTDDHHEDINNNNLYKRRSGGVVLKNLQLQRSQINSCRLQVNTV